ncbi:hypothetical protein JHK82_014408 [Glycine max]|nr:hypothetical protein JHK82_014408 [Glycine max]
MIVQKEKKKTSFFCHLVMSLVHIHRNRKSNNVLPNLRQPGTRVKKMSDKKLQKQRPKRSQLCT